jgi:hypothetical protein
MAASKLTVGSRVRPSAYGLTNMPGLTNGKVVRVVDEYAIDVLVDGRGKPQQFFARCWEIAP